MPFIDNIIAVNYCHNNYIIKVIDNGSVSDIKTALIDNGFIISKVKLNYSIRTKQPFIEVITKGSDYV